MGRPRIKKKKKKGTAGMRTQAVRLSKEDALMLMGLVRTGSVADGEKWLRAMRPDLDGKLYYEVAMRCGDPEKYGGARTGHDPEFGDYVDILVPLGKHLRLRP
ncbi:MAG: hypothetical protein GY898_06785 [Proteobacteria bacterium]|nr:hypothetical protein [Pseudomonadota bacterium]